MRPRPPRARSTALLAEHPPETTERLDFLHARFDAGLAWVHFPEGLGGLGLPRGMQPIVEKAFYQAGAPDNDPRKIGIGLGMAAPTILAFGTEEQKQRYLRPLWCGEEVWCQLFSEPGAGSDLAGLATRAVLDGDTWIVNGQKVWTSSAHIADRAILIARTDPDQPKHAGLSYFILDMHDAGRRGPPAAPDHRRGRVQRGLPDRRADPRLRPPRRGRRGLEGRQRDALQRAGRDRRRCLPARVRHGQKVAKTWRERPELRTPETHERLLRGLDRHRGRAADRHPAAAEDGGRRTRPRGLRDEAVVRPDQPEALRPSRSTCSATTACATTSWEMKRPDAASTSSARTPATATCAPRATRSRAARRRCCATWSPSAILGLPTEHRVDKDVPWKDLPR